jgi:hypothetical protein
MQLSDIGTSCISDPRGSAFIGGKLLPFRYGEVGDYVRFRRSLFLRFLLSSVFQGFLESTFKIESNADRL